MTPAQSVNETHRRASLKDYFDAMAACLDDGEWADRYCYEHFGFELGVWTLDCLQPPGATTL